MSLSEETASYLSRFDSKSSELLSVEGFVLLLLQQSRILDFLGREDAEPTFLSTLEVVLDFSLGLCLVLCHGVERLDPIFEETEVFDSGPSAFFHLLSCRLELLVVQLGNL